MLILSIVAILFVVNCYLFNENIRRKQEIRQAWQYTNDVVDVVNHHGDIIHYHVAAITVLVREHPMHLTPKIEEETLHHVFEHNETTNDADPVS